MKTITKKEVIKKITEIEGFISTVNKVKINDNNVATVKVVVMWDNQEVVLDCHIWWEEYNKRFLTK